MTKIQVTLGTGFCVSCGSCIPEAPDVFFEDASGDVHVSKPDMVDQEKEIEQKNFEITDQIVHDLENAVSICPTQAIDLKTI